ncbi:ATPase with role in protein import into the ER [Tulasnella sp. 408]|nr:ATPase with role in protein import into the ER [Tulasnella sp. 408]
MSTTLQLHLSKWSRLYYVVRPLAPATTAPIPASRYRFVSKDYRTLGLGKLNRQVENAKLTYSQISTKFEIESFEDGNDFFTRAKFEELNAFQKVVCYFKRLLVVALPGVHPQTQHDIPAAPPRTFRELLVLLTLFPTLASSNARITASTSTVCSPETPPPHHSITFKMYQGCPRYILRIVNEPATAVIAYGLEKRTAEVPATANVDVQQHLTTPLPPSGTFGGVLGLGYRWRHPSWWRGLGPTASFENGNDCSETFTRAKFEELNFSRKTLKPVKQVPKNASMKRGDIS